jgi:scyllo-inositol 2-dehydrogenase (NADP+)
MRASRRRACRDLIEFAKHFTMQTTPSQRIRVAAVGAGWVTRHRHIPALQRSPEFEVVGIIDRDAGRARAAAEEHQVRRWAGTPTLEVDWLDEVDAVTIGTPPATHFQLAGAALEAGKHVLMEKPVALRLEEGEKLQATAQRAARILAIVHNFQFARSAERLRRQIQSGEFGHVTSVLAIQLSNPRRRLPAWYESLPFGLFYDESPHLLYLIRSFAGEPTLIHASSVPSPHGVVTPAVVTAQFDCAGVPASLYMNFEAPLSEWHLCVMSERRFAAIDVFRDVLVEVAQDGGHSAANIMRSSAAGTLTHWRDVLRSGWLLLRKQLLYGNEEVVHRFARAVRSGVSPDGISIQDGLKILRLQHALMSAASPRGSQAAVVEN